MKNGYLLHYLVPLSTFLNSPLEMFLLFVFKCISRLMNANLKQLNLFIHRDPTTCEENVKLVYGKMMFCC